MTGLNEAAFKPLGKNSSVTPGEILLGFKGRRNPKAERVVQLSEAVASPVLRIFRARVDTSRFHFQWSHDPSDGSGDFQPSFTPSALFLYRAL